MPNDTIISVQYVYQDGPSYSPALRNAYEFFRRNANGRYSPGTLVAISRSWDALCSGETDALPHIVTAESPFTYDNLTEVKTGGVLGMMITWPEKAILAVSRDTRRTGIGTSMFNEMLYQQATLNAWVGRENTVGHHFCLSRGMFPTAMNGQGAVRYTIGELADD